MSYQSFDVTPISGALGAEVHGIDLSIPLSKQTFEEVHEALLDNLVIFFRDQDLTPEQQLSFARRFGGIHLHPYMKGLDDHPEVLAIIKEKDDTRTFGASWHVDQMFTEKPAMGAMLYAKELPPAGGDTLYANMYLAYDALSEGMKDMLTNVKTFAVGDRFKRLGGQSRKDVYKGVSVMANHVKDPGDVKTENEHPLVRTHPETGRKALFIGGHVQRFAGMTDEESAPLLNYLKAHTVRPEFTCRFGWKPGSLAFWDNRCTQHFAVGDYNGSRREMHRVTIQGDRPV